MALVHCAVHRSGTCTCALQAGRLHKAGHERGGKSSTRNLKPRLRPSLQTLLQVRASSTPFTRCVLLQSDVEPTITTAITVITTIGCVLLQLLTLNPGEAAAAGAAEAVAEHSMGGPTESVQQAPEVNEAGRECS